MGLEPGGGSTGEGVELGGKRPSAWGVKGELERSSMRKTLDETRPQELLGVVYENCGELRDSARKDEVEADCGMREKVLSELTLMALLGRLEEGGREDEARLDTLKVSGSGDARVRLESGRVNPETPGLIHDVRSLPWPEPWPEPWPDPIGGPGGEPKGELSA